MELASRHEAQIHSGPPTGVDRPSRKATEEPYIGRGALAKATATQRLARTTEHITGSQGFGWRKQLRAAGCEHWFLSNQGEAITPRSRDLSRHRLQRGRMNPFGRCGLTIAEQWRREQLSTVSFYQWRKKFEAEGYFGQGSPRSLPSCRPNRPGRSQRS